LSRSINRSDGCDHPRAMVDTARKRSTFLSLAGACRCCCTRYRTARSRSLMFQFDERTKRDGNAIDSRCVQRYNFVNAWRHCGHSRSFGIIASSYLLAMRIRLARIRHDSLRELASSPISRPHFAGITRMRMMNGVRSAYTRDRSSQHPPLSRRHGELYSLRAAGAGGGDGGAPRTENGEEKARTKERTGRQERPFSSSPVFSPFPPAAFGPSAK